MNGENALRALQDHYQRISPLHLRDLFNDDPGRADDFSIDLGGLYIDFSKNRITKKTLELLLNYADAKNIDAKIRGLFAGDRLNSTENRPALHTALRTSSDTGLRINKQNVFTEVNTELEKIGLFVAALNRGETTGYSGKPINTVVNVGIGGSDLGPRLAVRALQNYQRSGIEVLFLYNVDPTPLERLFNRIDPQTTLFIIASKSFSTVETLQNAITIKSWLEHKGCTDTKKHFAAVTARADKAINFGVHKNNIFKIWDWVGGRYSLWSATGLPIAIAIGHENFLALLAGAETMDRHFRETPMYDNAPLILALLDFWYVNFFHAGSHAFIPYDQSLSLLPAYLSQLIMESNGKTSTAAGTRAEATAPVVWGATGTNAQHSFFQLLHQGSHIIPVDFLLPLKQYGNRRHHQLLISNCLAQARALMRGKTGNYAYKSTPGNRPSTMICYQKLTPANLGSLLALFEHRTFVQGILWDINPFDQWGVELGKEIAADIVTTITGNLPINNFDSSTAKLLRRYKDENG